MSTIEAAAAAVPGVVELTRRLIRFDTTNPPGDEATCVRYVADLLAAAGVETRLLGREPDRPNLIARVPGRGEAPPLLLHAHVDVVPTEGQPWTRDPFAGELVDGEVRGHAGVRHRCEMGGGDPPGRKEPGRSGAGRAPTPPLRLVASLGHPGSLAHACLAVVRSGEHSRPRAPDGLIPLTCNEIQRLFTAFARPRRDMAHRLRWSAWRRRHKARTRTSHYRRQAAKQT